MTSDRIDVREPGGGSIHQLPAPEQYAPPVPFLGARGIGRGPSSSGIDALIMGPRAALGRGRQHSRSADQAPAMVAPFQRFREEFPILGQEGAGWHISGEKSAAIILALVVGLSGIILGSTPTHGLITAGGISQGGTSSFQSPSGGRGAAVGPAVRSSSPIHVSDTLVLSNNTLVPGNFPALNPQYPQAVVYDGNKGETFVAEFFSDTVSVISDATDSVVATIAVGTSPYGLAYDRARGEVFVADAGFGGSGGNVSVVSDRTNTVVSTIAIAGYPTSAAYDSSKGEVFVAAEAAGGGIRPGIVSIISDSNNTIVATIPVGNVPIGVSYDNRSGRVYVANAGSNKPGNVSVISDTSNTVVATIAVGGLLEGLTYDYGTREIFVTDAYNGLHVISGKSNAVVQNITLRTSPQGVTYDGGVGQIFVADPSSNGVTVISDLNDTIIATIGVGNGPGAVAYDNRTGHVLTADSSADLVTVISDSNSTVVASVALGASPGAVVYDAGRGELFIADSGQGLVRVMSDVTNLLIATVDLGGSPYALAYDSGKGEIFVADSNSGNISIISDKNNTVVATVPTGDGAPDQLVYDSGKSEIFVIDFNLNVSVISDTNDSVVATFAFGRTYAGYGGQGAAYDNRTGQVFVADGGWSYVEVVSDTNNTVVAKVAVGSYPDAVAYDARDGEMFVANGASDNLSVISESNDTVVATISAGTGYAALAYDNGTNEIAVADQFTNNVSLISTANDSVVSTVTVGSAPAGATYDWREGNIYVSNSAQGTISTIIHDIFVSSFVAYPNSLDMGMSARFVADVLGGAPPYTFTYAGLPPGCAASNNSTLECTPSMNGSFTVEVIATGVNGRSAYSNTTVLVQVDPTVSSFLANPAVLELGSSTRFNVSTSGGTQPFAFSYSGLPTGCATASSPRLSCSPKVNGTFRVEVKATDQLGVASFANATIVVNARPSLLTFSTTRSAFDLGQSLTLYANVSGGTTPLQYSYTGLPRGCTTANAPILTCTPQVLGSFAVAVNVSDSLGSSVTAATTIYVNPVPSIDQFVALPETFDVGQSTTFYLNASGGTGNLSLGYLGLPPGCEFGAVATASCTPTSSGTFTVLASVADGVGDGALARVTLTIADKPSVGALTVTPSQVDAGQNVTIVMSYTGGTGPIRIAYSGLPSGCTGTSTAKVACKPRNSGTYAIEGSIEDARKETSYVKQILVVSPDPRVTSFNASEAFVPLGSTVSFTVQIAGGHGGFNFTYAGLPPGCASRNVSTVDCTPTAVGDFNVTAIVTDSSGIAVSAYTVLSVVAESSPLGFLDQPSVIAGGAAVAFASIVAGALLIRRRRPRSGSSRDFPGEVEEGRTPAQESV